VTRNAERSATTQARLIDAARALFSRDGFAATSTDAILADAGVQRGALYHHFSDKTALFEAVCMTIADEALSAIDSATARTGAPLDRLVRGSIAWIKFTTRDDVRRILLVDAPTVLGWERWNALDARLSRQALHEALTAAVNSGSIVFDGPIDLLTPLINGALNGLALRVGDINAPVPTRRWHAAVRGLFQTLAPRLVDSVE
jgi:AcrR family transcriptional regulator